MQKIVKLSFIYKIIFLFIMVLLMPTFSAKNVSAKDCASISNQDERDSCYEVSVRYDGAGEEACALIEGTAKKDSCYDLLTEMHVASRETCSSIKDNTLVRDNCYIRMAQYITPIDLSYCDNVSISKKDSCYTILGWRGLGMKSCFATSNLTSQNECMIYLVQFSSGSGGLGGFLYSVALSFFDFVLGFALLYFLIKKFYLQKRGGILMGLIIGILNLCATFFLPAYNFLVFNAWTISEFICPPWSCKSDFIPDPRIFAVFLIVPGVYMLSSLFISKRKRINKKY